MVKKYWLVKSEPEVFSISDLEKSPDKTTCWDGVRNYQARNFIRDDMKKDDGVLFYHSNNDPLAVVGYCKVTKEAYADDTAFDPEHEHYDAGSTPVNPRWYMVDIKLVKKFKTPVTLEMIRNSESLKEFRLIQRGNRLSVIPVTKTEWDAIMAMGNGH